MKPTKRLTGGLCSYKKRNRFHQKTQHLHQHGISAVSSSSKHFYLVHSKVTYGKLWSEGRAKNRLRCILSYRISQYTCSHLDSLICQSCFLQIRSHHKNAKTAVNRNTWQKIRMKNHSSLWRKLSGKATHALKIIKPICLMIPFYVMQVQSNGVHQRSRKDHVIK